MANHNDTQAANIAAAAATPATDQVTANEASSSVETPKIEPEQAASSDTPKSGVSLTGPAKPANEPETPAVEAEALAVRGRALVLAVQAPHFSSSDAFASSDAEPEVAEAAVNGPSRWRLSSYAS